MMICLNKIRYSDNTVILINNIIGLQYLANKVLISETHDLPIDIMTTNIIKDI